MAIADLWPNCSCKGLYPQMLEHDRLGCSVIPTSLAEAILGDRPLTEPELTEIHDANERRRSRGYQGPDLSGDGYDAMRDAIAGRG